MNKKYIIRLTGDEQNRLKQLIRKGKTAAYKVRHANILLQANIEGPNWSDEQIANAFHCHTNTISNVRQRFVEEGIERALERKKQANPSREKVLDGKKEAKLIALCCSTPPEGYGDWTLKLLADKMIELKIVDKVSYVTVHRTLKKIR
jgi:transposase